MTLTPPFSRKGVARRPAHRLLELKPDGIRPEIIWNSDGYHETTKPKTKVRFYEYTN